MAKKRNATSKFIVPTEHEEAKQGECIEMTDKQEMQTIQIYPIAVLVYPTKEQCKRCQPGEHYISAIGLPGIEHVPDEILAYIHNAVYDEIEYRGVHEKNPTH